MKSILFILFSIFFVSFSVQAETLNVNKANASAIAQSLNGIGPVKAQAIVDYRTEHGAFESINDLTKVPGIGASIVERNKDKLSISDTEAKVSFRSVTDGKESGLKPDVIRVAAVQ